MSLFPLLAPGYGPELLRGPVVGLNALRCDSEEQLIQFVLEVAAQLDLRPESPSAYLSEVRQVTLAKSHALAFLPLMQAKSLDEFLTEASKLSKLAVLKTFTQTNIRYRDAPSVSVSLGWHTQNVEPVLEGLCASGLLDRKKDGAMVFYGLTEKGRAFAMHAGLIFNGVNAQPGASSGR